MMEAKSWWSDSSINRWCKRNMWRNFKRSFKIYLSLLEVLNSFKSQRCKFEIKVFEWITPVHQFFAIRFSLEWFIDDTMLNLQKFQNFSTIQECSKLFHQRKYEKSFEISKIIRIQKYRTKIFNLHLFQNSKAWKAAED